MSTTAADFALVGAHDESFREYGWEDVDWGYRLHLLGVPIRIPSGFTTLHHGPVTTTAERVSRALASGSARRRFEDKHGGHVIPVASQSRSVWATAVRVVARTCTPRTVLILGRGVDRVVGALPPWAAQKSVALLVEAAAHAGTRGR